MKYLLIMLLMLGNRYSFSQCANNNLYWLNLTPAAPGTSAYTTCIWGGEFVAVSVISGQSYIFSTCGTLWDTYITLYAASGGAALAFNNNNVVCGNQAYLNWTATITGTIYVLVDTGTCGGNTSCAFLEVFWIGGAPPPPPANDACANAIPIGCGQVVYGSTLNGGGETVPSCNTFMSVATSSVWYSFVGTGQTVTASLCISSYDTDLAVYTGNCSGLTCVNYNDDFCGLSSQVSWTASVGVTYYIRVAGYSVFDYGNFTLNLTCSTGVVTASDCINAVDVCENLSFQIAPNGSGMVNEIPPSGSFGNPIYNIDGVNSPWGTDNFGCLLSGELNSTWMILNIYQSGVLTFTFGGLGTQMGYYDWIMYPYNANTCQAIFNNQVAPIRCNWNDVPYGGTGLASVIPAGGDVNNYETPLNVIAGQQYIICFSNWSSSITAVPLQFGGTAVVGCVNLLLPVTLETFELKSQANGIKLNWTTLSEINNDYFVIERSDDNDTWKEIGRTEGAGTTAERSFYSFLDNSPNVGDNYYRLIQRDTNGEGSASNSLFAKWGGVEDLVIYPNPTNGDFILYGNVQIDQLQLVDPAGSAIPYTAVSDVEGNLIRFSLSRSYSGLVFIRDLSSGSVTRIIMN